MKKLEVVELVNGKEVKKVVDLNYVFNMNILVSVNVIDVKEEEDITLTDEYFKTHGATISIGSDSYPYTIISMNKQGTKAVLQRDDYKVLDSWYEQENIEYKRNPNGKTVNVYKSKSGAWKVSKDPCYRVSMKHRRFYNDPSF